jgi:hypothetical protein
MEVKINHQTKYIWVVSHFKDDTYLDGELCSPNLISDSKSELFRE